MKALLIAAVVIGAMVGGMFLLSLPAPAIIVAPEIVFHTSFVNITNTMFTSWFVVLALVSIGFFAGRGVKLVPAGFSAYVEAAVMALYGIVERVAGPVNARRFFPLVATIFFFVLLSNYFGLLPINNVIGVPEPGHGSTQAVFRQTTVAGVDLAYFPLRTEVRKIADGDPILVPAGQGGAHEGEIPAGEATPAGHGAVIGGDTPLYVASVAGAGEALLPAAPAAEEHDAVEESTDGSFSGILAPYFRSVNTDINAPLAIAIFSFIFVEFWGLQSLGFSYVGKFFAFGSVLKRGPMGLIDIFVGLLELVSEFSRIVSFTFRLFGNIFAGEVLLLMMTFLVPFVLVDAFYALELFVGLIQAFVFAMLTTVFAVTAVSHHGGEGHDEDHGGGHGEMAAAH